MSILDAQRDAMDAIIAYLTDTKGYVDDVGQDTPDFASYIADIDATELEEYMLNKMSFTPSFVESAVQEVLNFSHSWSRDLEVRQMSRSDYFSDHSEALNNDIEYYRGLKEVQTAYIQGKTPQQRN